MAVIEVEGLTHRYGRIAAVRDVNLEVPEGSLYALLGPNGAGKTTLLQILTGLLRPTSGQARVFGRPVRDLRLEERAAIGYVAEGQKLPDRMTLAQAERFLKPLYATWDAALAANLRQRFDLDPGRRLDELSRGERMKAALLCALAPRPRLLIMDEPFTGMDALVRDELVNGLLESAGEDGWTVLLCSHDIGELEVLADRIGFLDRGELKLSASMDDVRERFLRVDAVLPDDDTVDPRASWLHVQRSGRHLTFVADRSIDANERAGLPPGSDVETRPATLRELFVALARRSRGERRAALQREEVAA